MRSTVPSAVVAYLDLRFPTLRQHTVERRQFMLEIAYAPFVANVLRLVEALPERLLPQAAEPRATFEEAYHSLRISLGRWESGERNHCIGGLAGHGDLSPLGALLLVLEAAPDEAAEPEAPGLEVVQDVELRESLRADLGAVERALAGGEWKAGTVLAGAVVEAILLDAVTGCAAADIANVVQRLAADGTLRGRTEVDPKAWALSQLVEVCAGLGLIEAHTAAQCRIAKDFRNLIHPGREQRLSMRCTRATALSAAAAAQHAIDDLTRRRR